MYIYIYSTDQMQGTYMYKARVIYTRLQTHLYTEANTCLYMVKWVYTGDKHCLHEKANAFALYLASDLYYTYTCTCKYSPSGYHLVRNVQMGLPISFFCWSFRHDDYMYMLLYRYIYLLKLMKEQCVHVGTVRTYMYMYIMYMYMYMSVVKGVLHTHTI